MTTIVRITNEGPDFVSVIFYGEDRKFKPDVMTLKVGESQLVTVWDGHVPVIQAHKHNGGDNPQFFAVPPATF
jgi:hypothetical protein